MHRRTLLMTPLLAVPAAIVPAAPALAGAIPADGRIAFDVLRNGSPIGAHVLRFSREGEVTRVDITIDLAVRLLGIAVFRYTHRNTERWQGARLVDLASDTDRNGRPYRVRARREAAGVAVDSSEAGRFVAPPDIVTTSYWHPGFIQGRKLDTQGGKLLEVQVTDRGEETIRAGGSSIAARRWRIDGDLKLDIWYSREGAWSKLLFLSEDGSTIEYVRR